jgi:hypothetical protein
LSLILLSSSTYYAPPSSNSPRAAARAHAENPCASTALQNAERTFCQRNRALSEDASGFPLRD